MLLRFQKGSVRLEFDLTNSMTPIQKYYQAK